jgi:hypothetical protein
MRLSSRCYLSNIATQLIVRSSYRCPILRKREYRHQTDCWTAGITENPQPWGSFTNNFHCLYTRLRSGPIASQSTGAEPLLGRLPQHTSVPAAFPSRRRRHPVAHGYWVLFSAGIKSSDGRLVSRRYWNDRQECTSDDSCGISCNCATRQVCNGAKV